MLSDMSPRRVEVVSVRRGLPALEQAARDEPVQAALAVAVEDLGEDPRHRGQHACPDVDDVDVPSHAVEFRELDPITGAYTRQIPVPESPRYSLSGVLEPGTYRVQVDASRWLGDPFDGATPSPDYRSMVENVVVRAGATTPTGDLLLKTNYWGTVHPPASGAAPSDAGAFTSLDPARILDTRVGNGAAGVPIKANSSVELQVTGRGGVPAWRCRRARVGRGSSTRVRSARPTLAARHPPRHRGLWPGRRPGAR